MRFVINSFSLKWITQWMKQKVSTKGEGKRVRVPGISEFIATTDSEASDAEIPRFEDIVSVGFHKMLRWGRHVCHGGSESGRGRIGRS